MLTKSGDTLNICRVSFSNLSSIPCKYLTYHGPEVTQHLLVFLKKGVIEKGASEHYYVRNSGIKMMR